LVLAVIAFLLFVWPTAYRYDRIVWSDGSSFPVRTNRFTGTAEWLLPGAGWEVMTRAESESQSLEVKTKELKSLSGFDLRAIDLSKLRWESTGLIEGPVYNPTNYRIRELALCVEVYNKKDKRKLLAREYRDTAYISPRTVGDIIFNAGIEWKPGQEWTIKLTEAKGTQEVQIKTAKDFIEWKLSAVLKDPVFLLLKAENRKNLSEQFAEGLWTEQFPDFKGLSKAEQSRVIELLNKVEEQEKHQPGGFRIIDPLDPLNSPDCRP
jgi:hypothetical protein